MAAMLDRRRFLRVSRGLEARAAALLLVAGALLPLGCTGYQLALQPSATPPGALGVRQLPQQPQPVDPAAIVASLAQPGAGASAPQPASSAPAAAAQVAGAPATAAGPAAALAAPTITARPPTTASSSPAQNPSPAAVNGAPAASTSPVAPLTGATPLPSFTMTPTPSATPAVTRTPTPTATPVSTAAATPRPAAPVQVYLPAGVSDFLYVGATMPADRALAALAGQFDILYFKPTGATEQVAYRPGIDAVPTLPNNTLVRIGMKKAMSLTMYPPN
jgi:hypothetical protein